MAQALETVSAPVYIDFVDDKPLTARWLATAGFVAERPLTRMLLKRKESFQDTTQTYAVAGPAFSSWETAVTSCAGANGFCNSTLLGTPRDDHSSAARPVM